MWLVATVMDSPACKSSRLFASVAFRKAKQDS